MRIIVIGGGQCGGRAISSLREFLPQAEIELVSSEPELPYERPPLSKGFLRGDATEAEMRLHDLDWYKAKNVGLNLGVTAVAVDRRNRTVTLDDGRRFPWDRLLIATGTRARRLTVPGASLPGVHVLRDLADAKGLRHGLEAGDRLVVIGGGYLGLEVAAAARSIGLSVSVVEKDTRLMARALPPPVSEWVLAKHRAKGVDLMLGTGVRAITGRDRAEGVELDDGTEITAGIVLVAVGAEPNDDIARSCGLECDDGILVDAHCRTSDSAIFAAGDVARYLDHRLSRRVRLESWRNADLQAEIAAANMAGERRTLSERPWFWTDQYEFNIQICGLPETFERLVVRGDPADDDFTLLALDEAGRVAGAVTVNRPRDAAIARRLVDGAFKLPDARLGDESEPLKKLLSEARAAN